MNAILKLRQHIVKLEVQLVNEPDSIYPLYIFNVI